MNDSPIVPASRREVWTYIADAISDGGLPEPQSLHLYDDHLGVNLTVTSYDAAERWAGLTGVEYRNHPDPQLHSWWANRDRASLGWCWTVNYYGPRPTQAEVASAALTPDAEVSTVGGAS